MHNTAISGILQFDRSLFFRSIHKEHIQDCKISLFSLLPSRYLVHCLQSELNNYMPAFLDDPEENNPQRPKIGRLLDLFFCLLNYTIN